MKAADFFCGAGGSTTGMKKAGAEVVMAVNHWQLAIETHNTNHPDTDHDITDIQTTHPSLYPFTELLWMSPSCTSHSLAKGRKRKNINQINLWGETGVDPAEERSRATMREVVEFAAYHRNPIIMVENVTDIRYWQFYDEWLRAMLNLGYEYKTLYLNSMFFGVPQSRDRWYTVFWLAGNKAPDLDFRPLATCPEHGQINAVQSWKKRQWGKYRAQYVYRCPRCAREVEPPTPAAYNIIDWSLDAPLIGERKKPLRPKTVNRIKAGLRKYGAPHLAVLKGDRTALGMHEPLSTLVASASQHALIMDTAFSHADHAGKVRPVAEPLPTQTARQTWALLTPYYGTGVARTTEGPLGTITGTDRFGIVLPFLLGYYSRNDAHSQLGHPIPTIPTENRFALIEPTPFLAILRNNQDASSLSAPLSTIATSGAHHALIEPPALSDEDYDEWVQACGFRMLQPHELKLGMSFPDEYIVLGNKRDQVRQIGNAVTCNVAEWITRQCIESLTA